MELSKLNCAGGLRWASWARESHPFPNVWVLTNKFDQISAENEAVNVCLVRNKDGKNVRKCIPASQFHQMCVGLQPVGQWPANPQQFVGQTS